MRDIDMIAICGAIILGLLIFAILVSIVNDISIITHKRKED